MLSFKYLTERYGPNWIVLECPICSINHLTTPVTCMNDPKSLPHRREVDIVISITVVLAIIWLCLGLHVHVHCPIVLPSEDGGFILCVSLVIDVALSLRLLESLLTAPPSLRQSVCRPRVF